MTVEVTVGDLVAYAMITGNDAGKNTGNDFNIRFVFFDLNEAK
jgi:hypothetical protein